MFDEHGKLKPEVEVIIRGNYLRKVLSSFYENMESVSIAEARPVGTFSFICFSY